MNSSDILWIQLNRPAIFLLHENIENNKNKNPIFTKQKILILDINCNITMTEFYEANIKWKPYITPEKIKIKKILKIPEQRTYVHTSKLVL